MHTVAHFLSDDFYSAADSFSIRLFCDRKLLSKIILMPHFDGLLWGFQIIVSLHIKMQKKKIRNGSIFTED